MIQAGSVAFLGLPPNLPFAREAAFFAGLFTEPPRWPIFAIHRRFP